MEHPVNDFFQLHFDKVILVGLVLFFASWEALRPARKEPIEVELIDVVAVINVTFWALLTKALLTPSDERLASAPFASWPTVAKLLVGILIVDFLLYWAHVLLHKEFLWKTHRFHHAVTKMNWLKGVHTSATHIAIYIAPQILVGSYLFGFGRFEMTALVAFGYFVQFWQHANITVDLGILNYVFVTPQSHRVHHSLNYTRDSNFGAVLAVWDHLFKTYQRPQDESYPLGVRERVPLLRGLFGI